MPYFCPQNNKLRTIIWHTNIITMRMSLTTGTTTRRTVMLADIIKSTITTNIMNMSMSTD